MIKMKLPEISSYYCCSNLRTACIFIGGSGLVGSILFMIATWILALFTDLRSFLEVLEIMGGKENSTYFYNIGRGTFPAPDISHPFLIRFLVVLLLSIAIVGIISNFLVVYGAIQGKGDLYLFWLLWEGFYMILFAGSGGYVLTRAFLALFGETDMLPITMASHFHPLVNFVIILTFYLVITVEWGYTWAVVNTHRKMLARTRVEKDDAQCVAPL